MTYNNIFLYPEYLAGYDVSGCIVNQTILNRGYMKNIFKAPEKITAPCDYVIKKAIYGGHIIPHYGHMLTESISRLWAISGKYKDYVVLFFKIDNELVEKYINHEIFYELRKSKRMYVIDKPVMVQELVIPDPVWQDTAYTYPEMRVAALNTFYFAHKKEEKKSRNKKYYLSRRKLDRFVYGYIVRENELESELQKMGFIIIHPQELSFYRQVEIFNTALCVVGLIGSAFHTMLFADCDGLICIYLTLSGVNINFPNIDMLTGAVGYYVSCSLICPWAIKKVIFLDVHYALHSVGTILKENGVIN